MPSRTLVFRSPRSRSSFARDSTTRTWRRHLALDHFHRNIASTFFLMLQAQAMSNHWKTFMPEARIQEGQGETPCTSQGLGAGWRSDHRSLRLPAYLVGRAATSLHLQWLRGVLADKPSATWLQKGASWLPCHRLPFMLRGVLAQAIGHRA